MSPRSPQYSGSPDAADRSVSPRPQLAGPAAPGSSQALVAAAARLRRVLRVAAVILVAAQTAWTLWMPPEHAWASLALAAVTTLALLVSVWVVAERMVRVGVQRAVAWVGGGYILRIGILLACLAGVRLAGLDTRFVGIAVIVAVLVAMGCEVVVFARARVLAVSPWSANATSSETERVSERDRW